MKTMKRFNNICENVMNALKDSFVEYKPGDWEKDLKDKVDTLFNGFNSEEFHNVQPIGRSEIVVDCMKADEINVKIMKNSTILWAETFTSIDEAKQQLLEKINEIYNDLVIK